MTAALLVGASLAALCLSIARIFARAVANRRQHDADEHAQWLGADAGGSFIHNGSVSE